MIPSLLSVFLDYQCNFYCGHCSVGSSPKTKFPMPKAVLEKGITEFSSIPSAKIVVFTGGEATLRWDMLKYGIKLAKEMGLLTRLVSNSWWARSIERAKEKLEELKEVGLDEFNTSYDAYHAQFVSLEYPLNAVQAALETGFKGRVALSVILDKERRWSADKVRAALAERLGVSPSTLGEWVKVIEDLPTPTGTGEELGTWEDGGIKTEVGCPEIVKTISLHPNGDVRACCGHAVFYTPHLTLGNLYRETLKEILSRAQKNIIYWWIHTRGPRGILKNLEVDGNYHSICHACQVLLTQHTSEMLAYVRENRETVLADIADPQNFKKYLEIIKKHREDLSKSLGIEL